MNYSLSIIYLITTSCHGWRPIFTIFGHTKMSDKNKSESNITERAM